ncbi:unnamed protein product, partial [marine sediment metagenome]
RRQSRQKIQRRKRPKMDNALDAIREFAAKYHLVAFGLGGLVAAFLVKVFFQDVTGKWRWGKG